MDLACDRNFISTLAKQTRTTTLFSSSTYIRLFTDTLTWSIKVFRANTTSPFYCLLSFYLFLFDFYLFHVTFFFSLILCTFNWPFSSSFSISYIFLYALIISYCILRALTRGPIVYQGSSSESVIDSAYTYFFIFLSLTHSLPLSLYLSLSLQTLSLSLSSDVTNYLSSDII